MNDDPTRQTSRRERIATAALSGIISACGTAGESGIIEPADDAWAVGLAVEWADALIAELDKKEA